MTRDDIIRMAREAGDYLVDKRGREDFIFDSYGIELFANLVAAAEREACADVAENGLIGHTIAKAIRARGKE